MRMERLALLLVATWAALIACAALPAGSNPAQPKATRDVALQNDFSFDHLVDRMAAKARRPYVAPNAKLADEWANMSYDEHRAIAFRPDHAEWRGKSPFELQSFHLGGLQLFHGGRLIVRALGPQSQG